MKEGFGIQVFKNGDKYEGLWMANKRHGQGTYWKNENGKLRREYTGDFVEDKRHGRGTLFYKNGDRYDGKWVQGERQGEGRIIYANEDIYEGQWHEGKRNGYGVLTKRSGDHFEGHWVNDKREGQGSYYFAEKSKLFVGEWVDDQPKCGVYTEVEDEDAPPKNKLPHFLDKYELPQLPNIKLSDPTKILEEAMESTKSERAKYRAQYTPIEEMFTEQELFDLQKAFDTVSQGEAFVNMLSLKTLYSEMGFFPTDGMLENLLQSCGKKEDEDEISFELFARSVALLFEENRNGDEGEGDQEGVYESPEQVQNQQEYYD